ncbi:MAG: hypothetical protein M3R50_06205 [Bacteroidota bacterium]|nr:hypothetical protein [Bacteroidota bacterium]
MKKKYLKTLSKGVFVVATILFISVTISSCARKMSFQNSSVVPGAEGKVKIKKDKNKNYKIDLNVIHLTEARRLSPPRQTYVVWMKTDNNGTKNIGNLNPSSGLFSKTLKSSLQTVTPYHPESFFITAEDDASIQYPHGETVLTTN